MNSGRLFIAALLVFLIFGFEYRSKADAESSGYRVSYVVRLIEIDIDELNGAEAYVDVDGDNYPDFVFDLPVKYNDLLLPGVVLEIKGFLVVTPKRQDVFRIMDVEIKILPANK